MSETEQERSGNSNSSLHVGGIIYAYCSYTVFLYFSMCKKIDKF